MSTIHMEQVGKIYKSREGRVAALVGVDLTVEQGDFVFFVGSRGAGKSTLLELMAGELRPDRGAVYLDEANLARLGRRERARIPEFIGYVPHSTDIRMGETVRNNVAGVRHFDLLKRRQIDDTLVEKALALVGMAGSSGRLSEELTVSECRRVQVARAIMTSPDILLLDEVTDQVDDDTMWDLMYLFNEMNLRGTTIVMATNASRIVNAMRKRVVTLVDGKIVGDVQRGKFGQIPGRRSGLNALPYNLRVR